MFPDLWHQEDAEEAVHQAKVAQQLETEADGLMVSQPVPHWNLPLHQVRVEGKAYQWAKADLGTSLRHESPGDRSICICRAGDRDNETHQVATLVLDGPERDNTATCFKSQASCGFQLREVPTIGGQNHIRIMPSCQDVKLTPPGFAQGAVAAATTSLWYELNDTKKMRIENAGIYKLCWCHAFSPSDCDQLSDFNVEAGAFIYAGPYFVTPHEARISQGRFFRFGVLGNDLLAGRYELCWCPGGGSCETSEDFNVAFGSARIRCHWNFAELESGECERCRLLFEFPQAKELHKLAKGIPMLAPEMTLCSSGVLRSSRGRRHLLPMAAAGEESDNFQHLVRDRDLVDQLEVYSVLNRGNSTVEMSIQIGHRMAHLRLENAEATTEQAGEILATQDKQMIHDLVIEQEQSFQHINRVLKNCIGEALVECENSVNKQFEESWRSLGIPFFPNLPSLMGLMVLL
eukprot:Skav230300  [mRNA]  locus=scaffold2934:195676:208852:- [translate_table: standard]